MIAVDDGVVRVSGALTMDCAAATERDGAEAIAAGGVREVDLAQVVEADSSGIAVIFSWTRLAQSLGVTLNFVNMPQSLLSLAAVYDVEDLFPHP